MSNTMPMQSRVAKCKWKDRKTFYCGTFFTPVADGIEAARREAQRAAQDFFGDILPIKVSPPDSITLIPGMIIMSTEEEERQAA